MDAQYITVKRAKLNNNCPECYSREGLELIFQQRFRDNKLYSWITSKTTRQLYCTNCNSTIFPVKWTDDIERVMDYQIKAFVRKPSSFKLKTFAWILLILIGIAVLAGVLYVQNNLTL